MSFFNRFIFILVSIAPFIASGQSLSDVRVILDNKQRVLGQVEETELGNRAVSFLGIPYAEAPIGNLRWKPPVLRESMPSSPFRANSIPPVCPQKIGSDAEVEAMPMSEDCLYLNIWRPLGVNSNSPKLPVVLWIHGGGNVKGTSGKRAYLGANLASQNLIYVSINYRLNFLGFFAHPGQDESQRGNYGLYDLIAGLQWIKYNIESFGGDPNQITVMGESAGGMNINYLLSSYRAKGLFHRAIIESAPVITKIPSLKSDMGTDNLSAEGLSRELAKRVNCERRKLRNELECLRRTPWDKFVGFSAEVLSPISNEDGLRVGVFHDPYLFRDEPYKIAAQGDYHPVPLMIGSNEDEATFFGPVPFLSAKAYRDYMLDFFGRQLGLELLTYYPATTKEQMKHSYIQLMTDSIFGFDGVYVSEALSGKGSKDVYHYHFSRVSPGAQLSGGLASHGFEIPYFTNNIHDIGAPDFVYSQVDEELASEMSQRVVAFVKTSRPNASGLKYWPSYGYLEYSLLIDDSTKVIRSYLVDEFDFLKDLKQFTGHDIQ